MKFLYEYRTSDNACHKGVVAAANRDAAFAALKAQGVKPSRLVEAPGFFNHLFGKGKRWLAIGVLCALCFVLCAVVYTQGTRHEAQGTLDASLDSLVRRQPIGDAAVIEQGIRTGWADVFELEGDRFLASFAIPGTAPAIRSTTEEKLKEALDLIKNGEATSSSLQQKDLSSLEARQIRAMVSGMKQELREFLADGGTVVEYGKELVRRQEQELGYFNRAQNELKAARKSGASESAVIELWKMRNSKLRRMGIKLVPLPE